MTLEDFERSLAEDKRAEEAERDRHHRSHRKHREHEHHHHRSHHHDDRDGHRHKRRRSSRDDGDEGERRHRKHKGRSERAGSPEAQEDQASADQVPTLKRDSWMEAPSALDVEIVHRRDNIAKQPSKDARADYEQRLHRSELTRHHLQGAEDEAVDTAIVDQPTTHEVDYTFGDAGSRWRMTKLKSVYRQAQDAGQSVEEVAMKHYGDLRAFDDAREEEIELERRETYGKDYVGKEKPSGELFQERKLDAGIHRSQKQDGIDRSEARIQEVETEEPPRKTTIDPTELNRLKAKMMKAKLRGAPDAAQLEAEYNAAASESVPTNDPGVVVLGTMDNRLLAGGRQGEIKNIDNKRGRERGLVEENEDMSIADMVREERRTKNQTGGEGLRLAERIAKDGKFTVCISTPLGAI